MPDIRTAPPVTTAFLSCAGALVAIMAMGTGPTYGYVNGLAVVSFLLVAVLAWAEVKRLHHTRSVALLLVLTGVLFWYLYANAMAALLAPSRCMGWAPCFRAHELLAIFAHLCLFLTTFALAYTAKKHQNIHSPSRASIATLDTRSSLLDIGAVLAVLIGIAPALTSGLSLEELILTAALGRTEEKEWIPTANIGGDASTIYWAARLLLVAGLTLTFARLLSARASIPKRLFYFCIWCIPFVFQLVDTGTRYVTLAILLPGLLLKFLETGKALRLGRVGIAVLVLLMLAQVQLFSRTEPSTEDDELASFRMVTLLGSTDFFHESANSLRLHESLRGPILDNDALIFGTFLVPRSFWPDKPIPEVVREYTSFRWGIDILREPGNVFPGLIGQYLLSIGLLGPCLIGAVFGLLAGLIDGRLRLQRDISATDTLPLLCYSVSLFLSFRYFSPGYFVSPFLVHIACYFAGKTKRP